MLRSYMILHDYEVRNLEMSRALDLAVSKVTCLIVANDFTNAEIKHASEVHVLRFIVGGLFYRCLYILIKAYIWKFFSSLKTHNSTKLLALYCISW